MPFDIRFNNPLDADKFDANQVTVAPAIPGEKVVQNGTTIVVKLSK